MAEAAAAVDGEVEVEPAKAAGSRKKLIIIAAIAAVLLIAGAVGAYFLLAKPAAEPGKKDGEQAEGETAETYIDVPAMVVNLRSADGAARLIKLHLMLVPATAEKGAEVTARLPLIIDRFQPFLRELRPEDLAGSAAVFRIKEELLVRANGATAPGTVKDVLIQDLIQQ